MKHALRIIGYGIGGLAVAAALSLGAFALAGSDISEPIQPLGLPAATAAPHDRKPPVDTESPKPNRFNSPESGPTQSDDGATGSGSPASSPSVSSGSGSTPTATGTGSADGRERDDSRSGGDD